MSPTTTAGYVLAGGRSSRMGRDKASLPFRGARLIDHVVRQVREAAGSAAIVGAGGVPDLAPGFGPLAGIAAALADSEAEFNVIVACDMPHVSAEFLAALLAAAQTSPAAALVPRTPDGRVHALCAVYRRSASDALQQAVFEGVHTVRKALMRIDTTFLDVDGRSARALANVNTPEEWAAIQAEQE